jgi:hypothetical protein
MDILRGQTPAIVRKQIWAHLLVYNVVRTVMAQAAATAGVRPDEVSFAGALQTINAFLPELRAAQTLEDAAVVWFGRLHMTTKDGEPGASATVVPAHAPVASGVQ